MSIEKKSRSVVETARTIARGVESWADFSNAMFGQREGVIAKTFTDDMELQAFYDTPEYQEVNAILAALMRRFGVTKGAKPTKSGKFVVRLPHTLHEVLEVEAKSEGVSLNQLVVSKLSWPLREKLDVSSAKIVEAFESVHDGYSTDRVVIDPDLNASFLATCRELGMSQSDYALNHALFDIRKSKKAKLPPTTKRTEFSDFDAYRYASEIAVRVLQRTRGVTLDRILCDPPLRELFDANARRLTDESSSLKLRQAALNLRKTHNLKPMNLEDIPTYDLVSAGPLRSVDLMNIPNLRGTYVFYDHTRPLYAGETDNLRRRVEVHLNHGLADWIGDTHNLTLKYFAESAAKQEERLRWLRWFINTEKPVLNYQIVA